MAGNRIFLIWRSPQTLDVTKKCERRFAAIPFSPAPDFSDQNTGIPERPFGPKTRVRFSETTSTRPNRYRSEAPLYLASHGPLQDSDAIIHFAFDGADWKVKPNVWMQPWTLMSPTVTGQFRLRP